MVHAGKEEYRVCQEYFSKARYMCSAERDLREKRPRGIRFLEFLDDGVEWAAGGTCCRQRPIKARRPSRARRAHVTYEFKGFRETFVSFFLSFCRVRSRGWTDGQTSLFEHSLRQDEDVQSFVAAQGLPLLPSPENLYASLSPSPLAWCVFFALVASRALRSSFSSCDLLRFLRLAPLLRLAVRFWREGDRQRVRSRGWTRTRYKVQSREEEEGSPACKQEGSYRKPTG